VKATDLAFHGATPVMIYAFDIPPNEFRPTAIWFDGRAASITSIANAVRQRPLSAAEWSDGVDSAVGAECSAASCQAYSAEPLDDERRLRRPVSPAGGGYRALLEVPTRSDATARLRRRSRFFDGNERAT